MAKMFFTLEEAKSKLGRNAEEMKQLAREGRLREFRDGPRLMFKADQVEMLAAELNYGMKLPGDPYEESAAKERIALRVFDALDVSAPESSTPLQRYVNSVFVQLFCSDVLRGLRDQITDDEPGLRQFGVDTSDGRRLRDDVKREIERLASLAKSAIEGAIK
jgi:hypothetical protein